MEELLHISNPWWEEEYQFPGIARAHYLRSMEYLESAPGVVLITGLRRVGKTTLMHQYIHRLQNTVDSKRILYVSLDNLIFQNHTIQEIARKFRQINKLSHKDLVYLFLDEVHYMKEFELELKNLYDLGHVKIFASGSASFEIIMRSPHLTGRQRILRIHPLSFPEFLQFSGKKVSRIDQHLYENAALDYVSSGGMPEYVQTRDTNVLQSLVDTILYHDILSRHDLRNRENLKNVLLQLAQSASTPVSAKRFARVLTIKPDTVRLILNFLVEANLVHIVEREGSFSERKVSPRKFYLGDTGLYTILTERVNLGARVENLVYLTLIKTGNVRYSREGGSEVDFIVNNRAYESKYKREITEVDTAPIKALRGMKSKTIITESTEGHMNGVELIPLWRFLLEQGEPEEPFPAPPPVP